MRRLASLALAVALAGGAVPAALGQSFAPPAAAGRVYFQNVKNGQTIPATFTVKFGLVGLKVRPAGEDTEDRVTGHHHLIVDGGPVPAGVVIPTDATHLHYGKGQTEAEISLPPGRHTLTLQFADGAHRSYGPKWAARVTIVVK